MSSRNFAIFVLGMTLFVCLPCAWAQNSGSISGVVTDSTGAVVPRATVEIHNVVSGYNRTATTDTSGNFNFANIPFNPYHLTVSLTGFASYNQDVDVRSAVPINLKIPLSVSGLKSEVTVEAGAIDLIETESTPHTDVDRDLFDKLPLESNSSSVSSLVTLASPGVAADSNGLFHGLGDHAENSFSVDGQPITDQQSKVFSNQIPVDAIQSLEVISGAPPAEYGDKTSLVIKVTTRSGLGLKEPTGSVTTSYGSFGSSTVGFNLGFGGAKWGDFLSATGLNTGRFLDPPEFAVMHDKGNEENAWDRLDFQPNGADTLHFNFGFTRSWFQTPNSFDAQFHPCNVGPDTCNAPANTVVVNPVTLTPLGPTDQRSQIKTFNIAPTWDHLFGSSAVFTIGGFARRDRYNYYPSADPFADFSTDLQSASEGQDRTLTNGGVHADLSYVKGAHNVKVGGTFEHTLLTENDTLGIVDPGFLAGLPTPITCTPPTNSPACMADLTQGGTLFHFHGHGDIKEVGLFLQDTITMGSWSFNIGIRGDLYRGIGTSRTNQAEPRAGIAYNIKPTNTVLRVSYARILETPFNENLVVASTGDPQGIFAIVNGTPGPIPPGQRNDFHAGFQQAFGKYFVVDADYMWKYTHNGYDFSVLFGTPITYPIAWQRSKIYGPSVRVSLPNFHGLTAFLTASSVASRFFFPQVGGLGTDLTTTGAFRIDHDEKFYSNLHIQYQPLKNMPFFALNWRYDNGLVAGPVPCFSSDPSSSCNSSAMVGGVNAVDLTGLSYDQQFQAGLFCGSSHPTPTTPITSSLGPSMCPADQYGSTLIRIPSPGTENPDHHPKRIAPRHLFDLSVGDDNLLHGDRYKWSARVTVINIANRTALYNFLSTFSGTHYVTPRTVTGEIGFHF